jgi:putative oxidoreductase
MAMDAVFLAGRILFALVFVSSGIMGHLGQAKQLAQYARSVGAPAPELMVPLSGVVIIVGGLSVAIGVWADLGALLLAAFALSVAFFMHAFWREQDPQQQQNQLAHFMKNMGLVGGALVIFYVYNQLQGDAGLSITDPLFSRG